jgi:hypothetical protein
MKQQDHLDLINQARATGTWDRLAINALLLTNDRAVERALALLLKRQTHTEQVAETTTEANGVGFSALDAEIFTGLGKWVAKGRKLTPKQIAICRKTNKQGFCRIAKYWAQLQQEIKPRNQETA